MKSTKKPSFRTLIKGLSDMAPVVVAGLEYTGEYLATSVAINPNLPDEESAHSVQLISEIGRLTASAYADKQRAETRYRIWRDGIVYRMTNFIEEAKAAGFKCATPTVKKQTKKDKEAGKPVEEVPGKTPSVAEVERYLRTLPEYAAHYETQTQTEEAWSTLHTTLEAAKQRVWAIRGFERSGGPAPTERKQVEDRMYGQDAPPVRTATAPTPPPAAQAPAPPPVTPPTYDKPDTPAPAPIDQGGVTTTPPPGPPPPPPRPPRKG